MGKPSDDVSDPLQGVQFLGDVQGLVKVQLGSSPLVPQAGVFQGVVELLASDSGELLFHRMKLGLLPEQLLLKLGDPLLLRLQRHR